MDENMIFNIAHHAKNYIDLDTTKSSGEEESSSGDSEENQDTGRGLTGAEGATNDPKNIARNLAKGSKKKKKTKETAVRALSFMGSK